MSWLILYLDTSVLANVSVSEKMSRLHCWPDGIQDTSTLCSKKTGLTKLCQILTDFQNSFTVRLSDKYAIKVIVKDPTTS